MGAMDVLLSRTKADQVNCEHLLHILSEQSVKSNLVLFRLHKMMNNHK